MVLLLDMHIIAYGYNRKQQGKYKKIRICESNHYSRELLGMTSDSISQLRQKGLLSLVSKANNIISDTYSTNKGNEGGSCESIASLKHVLEKLAINWGRHDDILLIKLLETIARVIECLLLLFMYLTQIFLGS